MRSFLPIYFVSVTVAAVGLFGQSGSALEGTKVSSDLTATHSSASLTSKISSAIKDDLASRPPPPTEEEPVRSDLPEGVVAMSKVTVVARPRPRLNPYEVLSDKAKITVNSGLRIPKYNRESSLGMQLFRDNVRTSYMNDLTGIAENLKAAGDSVGSSYISSQATDLSLMRQQDWNVQSIDRELKNRK